MRNRLNAVALCLCALALPAARADAQILPAEDHVIELGVMLWKPSPQLILTTNTLSGAGVDPVDLVQEFGIEDKAFPEFRAVIGAKHKIRISYVSFEYDADATIQRTFTFRDRTITLGAPASTAVEWDLWTFGYEWDFVLRERGFVGVFADVKRNRIKASVNSPLLTSAAATDIAVTVPTVGVTARGYIAPMLAVTGEVTLLSISRDEFEGKFVDFNVYGTLSFGRHIGVQGGYRSIGIDYLVEENRGDLKMEGPYVGAVVRF